MKKHKKQKQTRKKNKQKKHVQATDFYGRFDKFLSLIFDDKYEEALEFNDKWLNKLEIDDLSYYVGLADCYIGIEDYETALDGLVRTNELFPEEEIVQIKFAEIYFNLSENEKAEEYITLALLFVDKEESELLSNVLFMTAILYFQFEMADKAIQMAERAVKANNRNTLAAQFLRDNRNCYGKEKLLNQTFDDESYFSEVQREKYIEYNGGKEPDQNFESRALGIVISIGWKKLFLEIYQNIKKLEPSEKAKILSNYELDFSQVSVVANQWDDKKRLENYYWGNHVVYGAAFTFLNSIQINYFHFLNDFIEKAGINESRMDSLISGEPISDSEKEIIQKGAEIFEFIINSYNNDEDDKFAQSMSEAIKMASDFVGKNKAFSIVDSMFNNYLDFASELIDHNPDVNWRALYGNRG